MCADTGRNVWATIEPGYGEHAEVQPDLHPLQHVDLQYFFIASVALALVKGRLSATRLQVTQPMVLLLI